MLMHDNINSLRVENPVRTAPILVYCISLDVQHKQSELFPCAGPRRARKKVLFGRINFIFIFLTQLRLHSSFKANRKSFFFFCVRRMTYQSTIRHDVTLHSFSTGDLWWKKDVRHSRMRRCHSNNSNNEWKSHCIGSALYPLGVCCGGLYFYRLLSLHTLRTYVRVYRKTYVYAFLRSTISNRHEWMCPMTFDSVRNMQYKIR